MPCCAAISHNNFVRIDRDEFTRPPSGSCPCSTNSKTPCFAEFLPVITPVQATGLSGGNTDFSVPHDPCSRNRARFGSRPS
jgi:hypothetical protein